MLFRLDELVRPYVHKILVVIEPLLIDEDYYARVEGRWVLHSAWARRSPGRAWKQGGSRTLPPTHPPTTCHPNPPPLHREIIANLAKAAGLATMIAAMRPDIDNVDEYVRNTTARAFSGGSLGAAGAREGLGGSAGAGEAWGGWPAPSWVLHAW